MPKTFSSTSTRNRNKQDNQDLTKSKVLGVKGGEKSENASKIDLLYSTKLHYIYVDKIFWWNRTNVNVQFVGMAKRPSLGC